MFFFSRADARDIRAAGGGAAGRRVGEEKGDVIGRDGSAGFSRADARDIIQTSLASVLAAPSVVGHHLRKQMAHVLAYLFEIEMLQAAIP